ncbi:hypothetical protein ACHAXA_003423 [Cyclostephanos tholiformis]|uniref:Uncharacterized protein n=1 Tax=Cyclostephanos tholiformis TaxID=382380 RepID=A0ABD3SFL3_9STRA
MSSASDVDPTSFIVTFALAFALYPAMAACVIGPLLSSSYRRPTPRDLLRLYRSTILSAFVVVPVWMHCLVGVDGDDGGLVDDYDVDERHARRRDRHRPAAFAALLSVVGIGWDAAITAFVGSTTEHRHGGGGEDSSESRTAIGEDD